MRCAMCSQAVRMWRGLVLLAAVSGLSACDRFDPSALLPAKPEATSSPEAQRAAGPLRAFAETAETADASESARSRDPEMQSIGPG